GVGGADDAVAKVLVGEYALDAGQCLVHRAAAGVRVGDEQERAERAGHDVRPFGFMIPAGSRAFLMVLSTPVPVSPSSPVRNGAFRRPTPWGWVIGPLAWVELRAACCHASGDLRPQLWFLVA